MLACHWRLRWPRRCLWNVDGAVVAGAEIVRVEADLVAGWLTLLIVFPCTSAFMTAPLRCPERDAAAVRVVANDLLVMVACTVPGCTNWVTVIFRRHCSVDADALYGVAVDQTLATPMLS